MYFDCIFIINNRSKCGNDRYLHADKVPSRHLINVIYYAPDLAI